VSWIEYCQRILQNHQNLVWLILLTLDLSGEQESVSLWVELPDLHPEQTRLLFLSKPLLQNFPPVLLFLVPQFVSQRYKLPSGLLLNIHAGSVVLKQNRIARLVRLKAAPGYQ